MGGGGRVNMVYYGKCASGEHSPLFKQSRPQSLRHPYPVILGAEKRIATPRNEIASREAYTETFKISVQPHTITHTSISSYLSQISPNK